MPSRGRIATGGGRVIRVPVGLFLGISLLLGPTIAYPGNWTTVSPSLRAEEAWVPLGLATYVLVALGIVVTVRAIRHLLRSWKAAPTNSRRRALAEALTSPHERRWLVVASVGYLLVVGYFLALYSWSVDAPGVWAASYPAADPVWCCGPIGDTPSVALLLSPTFEVVASPVVVVTLFLATVLFSMNVGVTLALVRRRVRLAAAGTASVGAVGALLVNCPTCGTVALGSVLAGSLASGVLVWLAAYSVPLMLGSLPASLLAVGWGSQQLARITTGARCDWSGRNPRWPGRGVRDHPARPGGSR